MEYTEVAARAQRLGAAEQEGHHMDPNDDKLDDKLDKEVQDALNPNAGVSDDDPSDLARDPVCGNMVDMRTAANTLTTPDDGTIYFDSPACKALYEENPEKYGGR
jgi:YHS domain-containing protein